MCIPAPACETELPSGVGSTKGGDSDNVTATHEKETS